MVYSYRKGPIYGAKYQFLSLQVFNVYCSIHVHEFQSHTRKHKSNYNASYTILVQGKYAPISFTISGLLL